jgi:REP element-mobilizing transposase RayT
MPRQPRVVVEGAVFHVYNRAARGWPIFQAEADASLFLDRLRLISRRDGWTIFAFCLLPSHYHIAFRSGPVPIARGLGQLQARFSQAWNISHESTGPVWQSRYKAKLVEDEANLYQLIAYIHLNPVSAGLAEDPAEWPWSGHLDVLGKRKDPIVDAATVLALYGRSHRAAVRGYVKSLKGQRECDWQSERPGRLPWWPASPDRGVDVPTPPAVIDERGVLTGLDRPQLRPEHFFELVCRALGADPQSSQDREPVWSAEPPEAADRGSRGRAMVAEDQGPGCNHEPWVRRCIERHLSEPDFARAYRELDEAVAAAVKETSRSAPNGAFEATLERVPPR